jgi:hypothetical protein
VFDANNNEMPEIEQSPVGEYRIIVKDSNDPGYVNRLMVATPATGLVRIEWVQGRYGQTIPTNWSMVQMLQITNGGMYTLNYQVADAQNVICRAALEGEFEWLLLVEHDTILPHDAFVMFNEYMRSKKVPVVSGLYYTRSFPSEPLLYRGRGTSYYEDWKVGDKVWVDGVPTGCLLIHCGILRAMWDDLAGQEYTVGDTKTRPVFGTPNRSWVDPETLQVNTTSGTSDLEWCTAVMKGKYFEKAGWPEYQEMQYPFLVDTRIFCSHINPNGQRFPI